MSAIRRSLAVMGAGLLGAGIVALLPFAGTGKGVVLAQGAATPVADRVAEVVREPQIVRLENLTWVEVAARMKSGTGTIIIPTGGTEQNGRHMVLGKHNYIVGEAAERIARRLGDALVAPVMAYVPEGDASRKAGHMAYPGTISLAVGVFESVLAQAATSFKTHGFTTIALLGDSGGNQAAQGRVAARLNSLWQGEGVRVVHVSDYYAQNGGDALLRSVGETAATIGTHAGIRDTAELMAVYGDGVDLANVVVDGDGASGDASRASQGLGERLIAGKVEAAVAQIRREMAVTDGDGAVGAKDDKPTGIVGWLLRAIFG